jgi:hypothetical protein
MFVAVHLPGIIFLPLKQRQMKQTYSEKLRDPRWQKLRLEILNRDNFTCQECLDKATTLHVHHKTYTKGKDPWEYENYNLITLCEVCHEIEEKIKLQKKSLKERLNLLYPKLFNSCPACGCEDIKMYSPRRLKCPLCGCQIEFNDFLDELI